ncbi:FAR-17a/AIG1-like protein [Dichomitus squalens]|uniref:FAR-17a/AIG1-like protein n=1 Tax=Dichomitus squalens TaxID=114155 RepID=A0A4Q9N6T2_9APHY|nr:FAR-17a/AIG1-like protein [Dichomitus squalens]
MSATVNIFPFLLHTTAAAVMVYGYLNLPDMVANVPMHNMKGGHFQFLTIQGLCVACITMVLSIGCDLFPFSKLLRAAKRAFLMSALPLAVVISVIYWTLLLCMPHMILMGPPNSEREPSSSSTLPEPERLPLQLDLALHAAPAIALIVDFYSFEDKYTKFVSRYGSLILASALGTWYACWVEYCASYNGMFPYPFLTSSPFNVRVAIYAGASLFAAVSFMVINALHP